MFLNDVVSSLQTLTTNCNIAFTVTTKVIPGMLFIITATQTRYSSNFIHTITSNDLATKY